MVGFTGETEEYFAKTCETFVDGPFSYFMYLPIRKVRVRLRPSQPTRCPWRKGDAVVLICADFLRPKYMDFHIGHEGREMRVLLDNLKDGSYFAYTDNYSKVRVPVNPMVWKIESP
mgnify:CR=1 FL=1